MQVPLTEEDDPVEAFFFDRTDEAFGVRVAIRRAVRRLHDTNPGFRQGLLERPAPLRVPIAEQDPMLEERAVVHSGQRARDLLDKPIVWMRGRAEQLHAAGGQVDDERRVVRDQAAPSPDLRGEKVGRRDRDRKSTRLNSSHGMSSRMPSSA